MNKRFKRYQKLLAVSLAAMCCVEVNASEKQMRGASHKQNTLNKIRKSWPELIEEIKRIGLKGSTEEEKNKISNLLQQNIDDMTNNSIGRGLAQLWEECEKDPDKLEQQLKLKMENGRIKDSSLGALAEAVLEYEIKKKKEPWEALSKFKDLEWNESIDRKFNQFKNNKVKKYAEYKQFLLDAARDGRRSALHSAWFQRVEQMVREGQIPYTQGLITTLVRRFGAGQHPMTANEQEIKYIANAWTQIVLNPNAGREETETWLNTLVPHDLITIGEWLKKNYENDDNQQAKDTITSILVLTDKKERNSLLKNQTWLATHVNAIKCPDLEEPVRLAFEKMYMYKLQNEDCAKILAKNVINKLKGVVSATYQNNKKTQINLKK